MAQHLIACPTASLLTHACHIQNGNLAHRPGARIQCKVCSTSQIAGQTLGASKLADPDKIVKVTPREAPVWANPKVKVRAPGCSHARSHCLAR